MRPGRYKTSAPLYIWKDNGTTFVTFTWEADPGPLLDHPYAAALIAPTFVDLPALIIQGARSVRLSGIRFEGQNNWSSELRGDYNKLVDESMYVRKGCRDSRHSPHCCVAVDPFGAAVPGDGGYPGLPPITCHAYKCLAA